MTEQVKRYDGQVMLGGTVIPAGFKTGMVSGRDYDALHAEAEALQRQVTELTNQRDAILLQARCWAGEAKAQQAITKAVGEALGGVPNWGPIAAGVEELRSQLEAARGLLREARSAVKYESQRGDMMGDAYRATLEKIDAFLTATSAPEVPDHLRDSAKMVEQGEPQEAVAFGWYTEDHQTDKSATTYDKSVAERWRNKGWPVFPLYTSQPAAQDVSGLVEALAAGHPRIDPNIPVPLDEEKYCCEYTLYLERERLHKLIAAYRNPATVKRCPTCTGTCAEICAKARP